MGSWAQHLCDRELVLRTFKRLHGRDAFGGGSGMGLSIAQRIVERHGGRMWIEDTPGGGTTVAFTLAPQRTGAPPGSAG